MEKFKENLEKLNSDQEFVSWMSWEEDMKKVHETELLYAKEEGIKTSKQEIARNLLSKNYSINEISEITGLSVEEIENLK